MNLRNLSDDALLTKLKTLVSEEREVLVQILRHLKEIERRKLHLERGYPSLWAYCTKELGYSEACAQRRIEAMRAVRDLPVIESKIESGELSLSVVVRAQSVLRKEYCFKKQGATSNQVPSFALAEFRQLDGAFGVNGEARDCKTSRCK